MNWTTIADTSDNGFNNFRNNTTLFKIRYPNGNASHYYWDDSFSNTFCTIWFHCSTYGQARYGMKDSIIGDYTFTTDGASALNPIDFCEAKYGDIEVYAFRDATDNSHYFVTTYAKTENDTDIILHSGVDTSNNHHLKAQTSKTNNVLDLLTFTTANQALNSVRGTNYILQPLCVYDEKTPFYIVSGNSNLAAFATITVDNKIFMSIGNGICIEVNEEG